MLPFQTACPEKNEMYLFIGISITWYGIQGLSQQSETSKFYVLNSWILWIKKKYPYHSLIVAIFHDMKEFTEFCSELNWTILFCIEIFLIHGSLNSITEYFMRKISWNEISNWIHELRWISMAAIQTIHDKNRAKPVLHVNNVIRSSELASVHFK